MSYILTAPESSTVSISRGTTPTLNFTVDIDTSTITTAYVTLKGKVTIEKATADITFGDHLISVQLTQAETLQFGNETIDVQIRCVTSDGEALASNIMRTNVVRILKEGVI